MDVQPKLKNLKERVLMHFDSDPLAAASLVAVLLAAAVAYGVYYRWSTQVSNSVRLSLTGVLLL